MTHGDSHDPYAGHRRYAKIIEPPQKRTFMKPIPWELSNQYIEPNFGSAVEGRKDVRYDYYRGYCAVATPFDIAHPGGEILPPRTRRRYD